MLQACLQPSGRPLGSIVAAPLWYRRERLVSHGVVKVRLKRVHGVHVLFGCDVGTTFERIDIDSSVARWLGVEMEVLSAPA